jgi:hypothetical protein
MSDNTVLTDSLFQNINKIKAFVGLATEERLELITLIQKWTLTFSNGRWDSNGNRVMFSDNGGEDLQKLVDNSRNMLAKLAKEL